jgi:hypothetical protein
MPAPSLPQLTHLGDGFFTVHANLEAMLDDAARGAEARELIWLVANAPTIRGAQFSCGLILFKGDDITPASVVANDGFAREHGIHQTFGRDGWDLVLFCGRRTPEQRQETMRVFMAEVPKMRASNEKFMAELKAQPQPA